MAIISSGGVIQVVRWDSATVTNVTTSNSEWSIGASQSPLLTTKAANSNFIYCCCLGAESDLSDSAAVNGFFRLVYTTNNFSSTDYVSSTKAQVAGLTVDQHSGTNDSTIITNYDGSHAAGTEIGFRLNFTKTQDPSYQFNQQSLSGQPSGTSNYAYGYVMEIGA